METVRVFNNDMEVIYKNVTTVTNGMTMFTVFMEDGTTATFSYEWDYEYIG